MVKPSSLKLLPYLLHDYRDDSFHHGSQAARGEADRIVHLSLIEERSHRLQTTRHVHHREAQTYTRVSRVTGSVGVSVGALIDIYA